MDQPTQKQPEKINQDRNLQQQLTQLKTWQEKCQLQNKKIKLYRKENQEIKHQLTKQAQIDTALLLNSKQLSDANTKLQTAIRDISLKLQIQLENTGNQQQPITNKPLALVTIQHTTITEQTEEIDLPKQDISDQDILQLASFRNLKSLILGENKIGDQGVIAISNNLTNVNKLQLNSNCFTAKALKNIDHLKLLKVLDLRNNNLGDQCMNYISKLQQLAELSISKNGITDEGINHVSALQLLFYLDLTTNKITDLGVKSLLTLQKLTHLYLMSNSITQQSVFTMYQTINTLQVLDIRFNINDPAQKEQLRNKKPHQLQLFC